MSANETSRLETELVALIIDCCGVPDPPQQTDPTAPLIGPDSPFGLDSLDAVEVVVAVQRKYGVRIGAEDTSREVLRSVRTLAEFIVRERG
jgi:acyl carrier protein